MKEIATSQYDFAVLREGDSCVYVDKTDILAKLPPTWTPKTEADAKRYFLLFMEMAGAAMHPEKPSARGFADAVVETKNGVWVMEFKCNRSAASAIRQIRERGYADAYRSEVKGLRSKVRQRKGSSASSNPTIQQSNNPTIQQSTNPTIQQSNNPTIQQSNNPTIQQSTNHPRRHQVRPRPPEHRRSEVRGVVRFKLKGA